MRLPITAIVAGVLMGFPVAAASAEPPPPAAPSCAKFGQDLTNSVVRAKERLAASPADSTAAAIALANAVNTVHTLQLWPTDSTAEESPTCLPATAAPVTQAPCRAETAALLGALYDALKLLDASDSPTAAGPAVVTATSTALDAFGAAGCPLKDASPAPARMATAIHLSVEGKATFDGNVRAKTGGQYAITGIVSIIDAGSERTAAWLTYRGESESWKESPAASAGASIPVDISGTVPANDMLELRLWAWQKSAGSSASDLIRIKVADSTAV